MGGPNVLGVVVVGGRSVEAACRKSAACREGCGRPNARFNGAQPQGWSEPRGKPRLAALAVAQGSGELYRHSRGLPMLAMVALREL